MCSSDLSAARQTLGKQLKEAEESIESLKEQVEGLQQALTRASEKAAAREERLAEDLRDAEQRLQESDARHEELAQRLPESTRPLLRQIETMRAQESERAEAVTPHGGTVARFSTNPVCIAFPYRDDEPLLLSALQELHCRDR